MIQFWFVCWSSTYNAHSMAVICEMYYMLIKDTSYHDCHCLSVLILSTHTHILD